MFRLSILTFLLGGIAVVATIGAQAGSDEPFQQPAVDLVFVAETDSFSDSEQRATELLFSVVEGAFRNQRRYRLTRTNATSMTEPRQRPTVFVSVAQRKDGRLGVETDLWDGSEFTASEVFDLPADQRRFAAVDSVARAMTDGIGALFPGFGRVRFSNEGYHTSFYVYADGRFLGADIDEIELRVGEYVFEVRRRNEGFEQVVGRRTVELEADDYVELRFALDRELPPIPGFLRLTNPNERWSALFDLRGSYLIPENGFDSLDSKYGLGVMASTLFNDVGLSGLVMGATTGQLYTHGVDSGSRGEVTELSVSPAMGVLGLSVGPVSGVDFIVRAAGGMALVRDSNRSDGSDDLVPSAEGVAEFGFGVWRNLRISLHASWLGIWDMGGVYSWIGVGLGIGGRF